MHNDALLVISPSPGIGDFIVRIPAVKLLSTRFKVTLICALPESMREEIYKNAGMQNIFGVNIVQMIEMGVSKKYNTLFDYYANAGSYTYATLAGGGSAAFADASQQLLIAIDNSRRAFLRPVARGTEAQGATFTVLPDDQWNLARLDKAGFFGSLEEGRVCLDARSTSGIIV